MVTWSIMSPRKEKQVIWLNAYKKLMASKSCLCQDWQIQLSFPLKIAKKFTAQIVSVKQQDLHLKERTTNPILALQNILYILHKNYTNLHGLLSISSIYFLFSFKCLYYTQNDYKQAKLPMISDEQTGLNLNQCPNSKTTYSAFLAQKKWIIETEYTHHI